MAALSAGTAALVVVLSACGGGSRVSPISGGAASSSAVVVQAGQGARLSAVVSGTDLWNWVPSNLYPSDIYQVPDTQYSTANQTAAVTKYSLSTESCGDLLSSAGGPGYGEVAYIYDEGANEAQTQVYAYGAYVFASADQASAYVKELAAKFASCASFSMSANGSTLNVTMSLGDHAEAAGVSAADTAADLREKVAVNGKTVMGDLLLAADGNVVVLEERSGGNGVLPTAVDLSKVADAMLAAFAQGEASGSSGAGGASAAPDTGVSPDATGLVSAVGGGSR
ncbi:sensor domain-containing protein [Actinospica durhamensis]|uniref:Sensor domain-containing protein n=1 Tax=Actinospica durhamensis TaxID=1508375 RepID=A0A941EY68_9ACTN|nr:sensor domain-containing protein [Actinospica durhamensis]MBR7837189.1 sensor domain-containing protein [Actinospica durhamensis]